MRDAVIATTTETVEMGFSILKGGAALLDFVLCE
jgi:hypothetical protein